MRQTIVAHADGDIQIKPNRQIPRASAGSTTIELLVSDPLHELDKADIPWRPSPQPLDGPCHRLFAIRPANPTRAQ
jgi:hypothetical protein